MKKEIKQALNIPASFTSNPEKANTVGCHVLAKESKPNKSVLRRAKALRKGSVIDSAFCQNKAFHKTGFHTYETVAATLPLYILHRQFLI